MLFRSKMFGVRDAAIVLVIATIVQMIVLKLKYGVIEKQQKIMAIAVVFFGLFFFVRLCLSPVHYIVSNQSIGQSALQVWRAGIKRNGVLIIYALLTYLLLPLVVNTIGAILGS